MFKIGEFTCENMPDGCITDERTPHFSFYVESDVKGEEIEKAEITIDGCTIDAGKQVAVTFNKIKLKPYTKYTAELKVWNKSGDVATDTCEFETGRYGEPWKAKWITDGTYKFTEKRVSPTPLTFHKRLEISKKIKSAKIYSTAIGVYEIFIDESKVGDRYFAPGFTSYRSRLEYQVYDVKDMLNDTGKKGKDKDLYVVVAGGWAVGSFVFSRKNRITADRQALLLELHITYEDGSSEIICSDESFEVTRNGNFILADLYDGETYDASVDLKKVQWIQASEEKIKIHPDIFAETGSPVKRHENIKPISCQKCGKGLVYDFGQNFAGVVKIKLDGKKGWKVVIKHAEILNADGTINTSFLRTAKATATYICTNGIQDYTPSLTYMGFRYIYVEVMDKEQEVDITSEFFTEVSAYALYSDLKETGEFECSHQLINRLNKNIIWSSKSNFVEIPTDCPQRDERMGWTGDIAVFAPTANFNFEMTRFLDKWLADMEKEQLNTGGIPNTIPVQGYGFPVTMPVMAIDFWGDASVLVPWSLYMSRGDENILRKYYKMMKKYVDACKFWAGLFSVGKHRYLWNTPSVLHFGDWVAPDVHLMSQWQKRSKWTATASLAHTSGILAKIAGILGEKDDEKKYKSISEGASAAYASILSDGHGKMKEEFQTAYVLPIQFDMFKGEAKENAVENLVKLVEKNDYCIGTGFPGTPYILFALADNGKSDVAYNMLFNEKCPSWLYEVKAGATTIWERWDGLDEDGNCPIGDDGTDLMISYNHYASGAVGYFLYSRILGIEATEAGYKKFKIAPLYDKRLQFAKGSIITPYGKAASEWHITDGVFNICVEVPVGTSCELIMPNGDREILTSGKYEKSCLV